MSFIYTAPIMRLRNHDQLSQHEYRSEHLLKFEIFSLLSSEQPNPFILKMRTQQKWIRNSQSEYEIQGINRVTLENRFSR